MQFKNNILIQAYQLLTNGEKKQLIKIFFSSFIVVSIQSAGIISILPFIAILSNPDIIETHSILNRVYNVFSFNNQMQFLTLCAIVVVLIIGMANLFSIFQISQLQKFLWSLNHNLSVRIITQYLYLPYRFFIAQKMDINSQVFLSEIQVAITNIYTPLIQIVSNLLAVICILFILIWFNPFLTSSLIIIISGLYYLIYLMVDKKTLIVKKQRYQANINRLSSANEALSSIKEVTITHQHQIFINRFEPASKRYSDCFYISQVIVQIPHHLIEILSFAAMIIVIMYLQYEKSSLQQALPLISLFAFSFYRIMPAVKQIFTSITMINFQAASFTRLLRDFTIETPQPECSHEESNTLIFTQSITLNHLHYQYPNKNKVVLNNISMTIQKNAIVAITGPSGVGKSTLLDILLGLLEPTSGEIIIDQTQLNHQNVQSWHNLISYIPQNTLLFDDSILFNITLDKKTKLNDDIKTICKGVKLDAFAEKLPNQYSTYVGEDGKRLSQGQKQRIGIARALYRNTEILILDEPTSALDFQTEHQVLSYLDSIKQNKTIIMVTHKLSTLQFCDQIIVMEAGGISASGNFDEVIETCDYLKALNASNTKDSV